MAKNRSSFLGNHSLTISLIALLSSAFFLLSWTHRHQPQPLSSIATWMLPAFKPEEKKVAISVKALSTDESKELLGHDLLSRDVQPIHLTIENNTPDSYSLCSSSVDLNRMEAKKVAWKVSKSSMPRAIGYKIAGFLFWPFMIPGTIDSIKSMRAHNMLKRDLQAKSMKKEVIPAYSVFNRLLFVPQEDVKETFNVTLIELESLKPLTISVSLKPVESFKDKN